MNGTSYEMIIWWSDEDAAYVVEVPELPGCMAHGKTRPEAIRQAEAAIRLWIKTAKEDGLEIPRPRGKALTGGYLNLAATPCTAAVAEAISGERGGGGLMHGPTFMANPLACAVALASLGLLEAGQWHGQVAAIERGPGRGLERR